MSVKYRISKVKNPSKNAIEGTTYYACKSIKVDDYTFKDLAEEINDSTTVTRADATAVFIAMQGLIARALRNGRRVVLDNLGSLRVNLRGKCFSQDAMAASDFSPAAQIQGHRISFLPDVGLKRAVANGISYEREATEA